MATARVDLEPTGWVVKPNLVTLHVNPGDFTGEYYMGSLNDAYKKQGVQTYQVGNGGDYLLIFNNEYWYFKLGFDCSVNPTYQQYTPGPGFSVTATGCENY